MIETLEPLFKSLTARVSTDPNLAVEGLVSLARPSIRLAAQRVPYARIEIGQSRKGGIPDVPPDFKWPRWTPAKPRDDKYGHTWNLESPAPLGFIAQIDFSETSRVDDALPDTGWLYFFYDRYSEPWGFDSNDRGCCRIIYANCDRSALCRMEPPPDAAPEHLAEACLIESWPQLTLPDNLPDIEYGTSAFESYYSLCDD
jgi:hypothetical protein